jgi:hypothetical protein
MRPVDDERPGAGRSRAVVLESEPVEDAARSLVTPGSTDAAPDLPERGYFFQRKSSIALSA